MTDPHISDASRAVLDALHQRRSIRRFTGEPVTRDEIVAMLDAARWAPSGLNNQPWRFLVVQPGDPRQEALAGCTKYARIVRDAGVLVAVFLDREACYHPMKDHQGAGACIQNLLLAAHALGLGAVWLGEIVNQAEQVEQVLGLPAGRYEFMALIAAGHPAQRGSSDRVPLEKLLLEAL
ncbi:nitroreductase family protein [Nitratidesulfovibrio liaohensis]|uniref:nitroreductase family protein n=1 Tax=Nitratidesulfovibrio liaohensis TaxID=2604158 RepID=UPI00141DF4FD|nr:nitroreductase family protein [Nitratidesulfovibrio liaohensis]NHZ47178.1 nitroreductase family protein [Nitratidesulfovibrio liaohensis]